MGTDERLESLKQNYRDLRLKHSQLVEKRSSTRALEQECKVEGNKLEQLLTEFKSDGSHSDDLRMMSTGLHEIQSSLPKPSTLFLRLILGDISCTLPSTEDRLLYKQNYETFKMVHVVCMCLLGVLCLVFPENPVLNALVHLCGVWYYFTVTLRELILISNGSKIKWWWLTHHYCSMAIAALLLSWPPGECYDAFKGQFMLFTCTMSFVMALQFRYQRAKLYREVAMGVKHHMTVSQEGEGKLSNMSVLVMCLIGIYLFQLCNACALLYLYFFSDVDCPHWQVPLLGALFLFVSLMNSSTLSSVIYGKKRKRQ